MNDIDKMLEDVIHLIGRDTYNLTRDDIDSVEWRVRDLQKYIRELYASKSRRTKASQEC